VVAGRIVTQAADGHLQHFETVGYVVVCTSLLSATLLWRLQRNLPQAAAPAPRPAT